MGYTDLVLEYFAGYTYTWTLIHKHPCKRPYIQGTVIYFDFDKADMTCILKRDKCWITLSPEFGLIPVLHNPAIVGHRVELMGWCITDDDLDELVKTRVKELIFSDCTWVTRRTHRFDGKLCGATPHILTIIWPTTVTAECTLRTLPPTVRHLDIEFDEDLQCPLDQLESLTAFSLPYTFCGTARKPVWFYSDDDDIDLVSQCIEQHVVLNDDLVMAAMYVLEWMRSLSAC